MPTPRIYLSNDYLGTPPDLEALGISTDSPSLVANPFPTIYSAPNQISPPLGTAYAATLPASCPFLALSFESIPGLDSSGNLLTPSIRIKALNEIAALFAYMRAERPTLEFYLEPYPLFDGSIDWRAEGWEDDWAPIQAALSEPAAGFPRGFFSVFDGVFVNMYRRYSDDTEYTDFVTHKIEASRQSHLPIHTYFSPREVFSFTNFIGGTTYASQRVLDPGKFSHCLDLAMQWSQTVTLWDSKQYGTATTSPSSNGSLAGNWGINAVSQAAYPGQAGTTAGYGLSSNWATWTGIQAAPWWTALLATLKARGYY